MSKVCVLCVCARSPPYLRGGDVADIFRRQLFQQGSLPSVIQPQQQNPNLLIRCALQLAQDRQQSLQQRRLKTSFYNLQNRGREMEDKQEQYILYPVSLKHNKGLRNNSNSWLAVLLTNMKRSCPYCGLLEIGKRWKIRRGCFSANVIFTVQYLLVLPDVGSGIESTALVLLANQLASRPENVRQLRAVSSWLTCQAAS